MTKDMQASHQRRTILWEFPKLPAMEICRFSDSGNEKTFEGVVLVNFDGGPAEIRYAVTCDTGWRTRAATVALHSDRRIDQWNIAVSSEGEWSCNGAVMPEFHGLIDIDLGFSPCTNTLPIRRVRQAVGETTMFTAVWLRFPELRFERLDQRYTRLSEERYRYESGGGRFTADLHVDDLGLVVLYGEFWRRPRRP
jgi:hypothetical protein